MGLPGYYLLTLDSDGEPVYNVSGEPVISGSLVTLPVQRRLGADYGYEAESIIMTTERGRRWVYPEYEREVRRMVFRLQRGSELDAFYNLHVAVRGHRDPFIFIPDTSESPYYTLFCRKEQGFFVHELENVAHGGMVDYVMTLTEEPTGPAITD